MPKCPRGDAGTFQPTEFPKILACDICGLRWEPLPLFCCDEPLTDLHQTSIVSRTHSVAGMMLGSNDFWRTFQCPACGRLWIDSHDHHTGSGYDCEWMPQQMMFWGEPHTEEPPRDGLIRMLYQRPRPYRTEDTEYGCQVPREAE